MALAQLEDDRAHYLETCSAKFAATVWRHLAANVGSRNLPPAEAVHVIEAFAKDCREEGWSEYTLDRAAIAWRRSSERFMPTFGQLRACVKEARQKGGPSQYREMNEMLNKLIGSQATKTIPAEQKNDLEDRKAHVAKLLKDKARGFSVKLDGSHRTWLPIDDRLLKSIQENIERMEAVA